MFARMIAVTALLASAGVAFASDASYDLQQTQSDKAAPALKDAGAKDVSTTAAPCSCQHARS
jgi:hypothetical protein